MNTASAPSIASARSVVKESRPACRVPFDQRVEARLVDRDPAVLEHADLGRVLVDAGDLEAELGEAGAGHKADIAGADHRNPHRQISSVEHRLDYT